MNLNYYHMLIRKLSSTIFYRLSRIRIRIIKNLLIWLYIKVTGANTVFAKEKNPYAYLCLNDFFTRPLADNVRPINMDTAYIISPVDGRCIMYGDIYEGEIFQAKKMPYSLSALFNSTDIAAEFINGQTITLYLAPDDYHRIHMPCDGKLLSMSFCPGDKRSVALDMLEKTPQLFCSNERLVCHFTTHFGEMMLIFVGALNVSSISTVWHGNIYDNGYNHYTYNPPILFHKGEEIGHFNLGSTVILCFNRKQLQWKDTQLQNKKKIQMGEPIARIIKNVTSNT